MISTEARIMQAALNLFSTKGLQDTSLKEIAEIAKVNPSAINYHFINKDILYCQVIEEIGHRQLNALLEPFVENAGGAKNREEFQYILGEFIQEFLRLLTKEHYVYQMLIREFNEGLPYASKEISAIITKLIKGIAAYFSASQSNGVLPKKINCEWAAHIFIMMVSSPFEKKKYLNKFFELDLDSKKKRDDFVQQTLNIFLNGIM